MEEWRNGGVEEWMGWVGWVGVVSGVEGRGRQRTCCERVEWFGRL